MTVSPSDGIAPIWWARKVTPRSSEPRMTAIQMRVVPAFLLRGSLKAVMPLEIASTPVRAVVPLANARRTRNSVTAGSVCTVSMERGDATAPSEPVMYRTRPTAIVA